MNCHLRLTLPGFIQKINFPGPSARAGRSSQRIVRPARARSMSVWRTLRLTNTNCGGSITVSRNLTKTNFFRDLFKSRKSDPTLPREKLSKKVTFQGQPWRDRQRNQLIGKMEISVSLLEAKVNGGYSLKEGMGTIGDLVVWHSARVLGTFNKK